MNEEQEKLLVGIQQMVDERTVITREQRARIAYHIDIVLGKDVIGKVYFPQYGWYDFPKKENV